MNRAAIILLVLLVGCDRMPPPRSRPDGNQVSIHGDAQAVYVYSDAGTGCQYVAADGNHSALTPRIAADGHTHMGCKGATP